MAVKMCMQERVGNRKEGITSEVEFGVWCHVYCIIAMSIIYKSCSPPSGVDGFLHMADHSFYVKGYMSNVSIISLLEFLTLIPVITWFVLQTQPAILSPLHFSLYLFFRFTSASKSSTGWLYFYTLF